MTEKILAAENGDVDAMIELAKYYASKSKVASDKVGDVLTVEEFQKMLQNNENAVEDVDAQAEAYKYWRMAAEAGNAEAMTEVGGRLYDGIGVEKDAPASKIWYRKAAEAGDPTAMRVVACTTDDPAEEFKWHKLAAELLPPSLNKQDSTKQTAISYAAGRGTEKNLAEAETWLAKLSDEARDSACIEIYRITKETSWLERASQKSPRAMVITAESFVEKNDMENARLWYERAGEAGDFESTSVVGDIYYVAGDFAKAREYYERAAAHGYNMADVKIALMTYYGRGCTPNHETAFKMFRRIAGTPEQFFGVGRFNSVAKFYLAKLLEDKDPRRSMLWYERAAALKRMMPYESTHKVFEALYKVADHYFMNGKFDRAVEIYTKLADGSIMYFPYNMLAAKKLVSIYELGEGVPINLEEANKWREKLTKLND